MRSATGLTRPAPLSVALHWMGEDPLVMPLAGGRMGTPVFAAASGEPQTVTLSLPPASRAVYEEVCTTVCLGQVAGG